MSPLFHKIEKDKPQDTIIKKSKNRNVVKGTVAKAVKNYLAGLSAFGIHASKAVLFGSFAQGQADDWIEPIPCGEREWETEHGRAILDIARQEGIVITA